MMQHSLVCKNEMIFGVRVVPVGKLFETNTAGRQVGSGQCSTAECPLLGEQRKTFARFEFFRFGPNSDIGAAQRLRLVVCDFSPSAPSQSATFRALL
jgi:hypothetical protein